MQFLNGNLPPKVQQQQQPTIHVTCASANLSTFAPTMTSSPNHSYGAAGGRLLNGMDSTEIPPPPCATQMQHLTTTGQHSALVGSPRHRNSTGSNSSQASSGFESMKSSSQPHVNATVHTLRGDSPPSRNSVHSSGSSSLGSSLERLDESGYASQVNISEMIMNGIPDQEVLSAWLHDLRYEDYLPLFLNAGYDLPTVARMTPEDLTAIGITKPGHRKRITTEIHKLAIGDPWPPRAPPGGLREWLAGGVNLPEYVPLFESQGYETLDQVAQLTWEDFEDIGIKKLGHLKKLGLAIKKLKDGRFAGPQVGVAPPQRMRSSERTLGPGGEVLVINVPLHQAPTAEVRPYCHLPPPQQMSPRMHSPQMQMSTFQHPPSSPRERSPAHQNGYDTFPRRSSNTLLTEAIVHNASGTPVPARPLGAVKPRPVAKIAGETKRSSRELTGSDESLEKLKSKAVLYEGTTGTVCGNYANFYAERYEVDVEISDSNPYAGMLSPRLQLSRLGGQGGGRRGPGPPVPPKRTPVVLTGGPRYGPQLSEGILNESCDSFGLSPAPSMDDLPPPPAPPSITCEESIRNLRSIMTSSTESATGIGQNRLGRADSASCSSSECLPFANENVGTIKSRHHSPPGTATTENGESHVTTTSTHSPAKRTNVKDLFPSNPPNLASTQLGDLESKVGQPVQVARYQAGQNGDVLTDIGSMLQNLTDELDQMLGDSSSGRNQH